MWKRNEGEDADILHTVDWELKIIVIIRVRVKTSRFIEKIDVHISISNP